MNNYSNKTKDMVINLRKTGLTYSEIAQELKINIPKSTLSTWCKNIKTPANYNQKISNLNQKNLVNSRKIALSVNRQKRLDYLKEIDQSNINIAKHIKDVQVSQIALSMLCLGDASKSKSKHKHFSFGNSNPQIIKTFLELLKKTPDYNPEKLRCTIQCRADQNTNNLEKYWQKITNIPIDQFYKTRIDKRTINKPTKKTNYKGVLVVDYYQKETQLRLESLANIIYNLLVQPGPVA